jgi:DNA-binding response OmpR family regulator
MRLSANEPRLPVNLAARVLLAEDDGELRALIAHALRGDGFDVIEVCDGKELVDSLADALAADGALDGYDLVISDVRMPGFTAIDVLTAMRPFLARTPVVLITAFGDEKTHERARRLGAAAVIDKPFDLDELRGRLRELLRRRLTSGA